MELRIHPHAAEDIRELLSHDVNGAGKLLALLQAIQEDPDLIDRLNIQGEIIEFDGGESVDVLRVECVKNIADVWRLKGWGSNNRSIPYRLIYAFFPAGPYRRIPRIEILAAVSRSEYNYEPQHSITVRVLSDYRDII